MPEEVVEGTGENKDRKGRKISWMINGKHFGINKDRKKRKIRWVIT